MNGNWSTPDYLMVSIAGFAAVELLKFAVRFVKRVFLRILGNLGLRRDMAGNVVCRHGRICDQDGKHLFGIDRGVQCIPPRGPKHNPPPAPENGVSQTGVM